MSDPVDRREFLKRLLALSAAGAAIELAGCGPQQRSVEPKQAAQPGPTAAGLPPATTEPPTPTASVPTAVASQAPAPPTATRAAVASSAGSTGAQATAAPAIPAEPAATADLAVARGAGADPAELTRRAIAAIGGIERFVKQGADVIVKPNICSSARGPEYAATTNPQVVAAIVALCLAAGARRVRVMDLPFSGTPQQAYEHSGIAQAVAAAGGTMEIMSRVKYKDTPIPRGKAIHNWAIYQDVLQCDALINVPIPKHHSLAGLTLGLKNLMGVVGPDNRGALHSNIYQRLADLASVIRPTLTVVDAVRILTANGPTGGNLGDVRKLDTVIATADPVAADAYACTLFGKGKTVGSVATGAAMGLGEKDLTKVKIAEIAL